MNGETIAVIVLGLVVAYLLWERRQIEKATNDREKDLLNRVMTRSYQEFVQGDVARVQVEKPPMTPEEIYNMQQEMGIPV